MSILIKIKTSLSINRDFLFTSIYPKVYAHFIITNIQFVHLKNDLDRAIHITLKNGLRKIIKMKEEDYYLINKNSHGLAILKSISKCERFERPYPSTNIEEDVIIFYDIKVHKDAEPHCLNKIVNKHPNVWFNIGRMTNIPEEY